MSQLISGTGFFPGGCQTFCNVTQIIMAFDISVYIVVHPEGMFGSLASQHHEDA